MSGPGPLIDISQTVGVLLAGGLSRRMSGQEKSLITLAGKPLIVHVYERLKPQVERVVISANSDPDNFSMLEVSVVADHRSGHMGPLAGLESVMLVHKAPWYVTVATDTPFFPKDLVNRLASGLLTETQVSVAQSGERVHPVVGLWPRAVLPLIQQALDDDQRAIKWWLRDHDHSVVRFQKSDKEMDPFFNINSPDCLQAAKHYLDKGIVC
ncbi:MAG: molybdenum cofactor guanylyltransferase [Magnetococcales bacterium]|nr:molybdenum cofactor guanylyltransferase [Magnetococcales bacterium]